MSRFCKASFLLVSALLCWRSAAAADVQQAAQPVQPALIVFRPGADLSALKPSDFRVMTPGARLPQLPAPSLAAAQLAVNAPDSRGVIAIANEGRMMILNVGKVGKASGAVMAPVFGNGSSSPIKAIDGEAAKTIAKLAFRDVPGAYTALMSFFDSASVQPTKPGQLPEMRGVLVDVIVPAGRDPESYLYGTVAAKIEKDYGFRRDISFKTYKKRDVGPDSEWVIRGIMPLDSVDKLNAGEPMMKAAVHSGAVPAHYQSARDVLITIIVEHGADPRQVAMRVAKAMNNHSGFIWDSAYAPVFQGGTRWLIRGSMPPLGSPRADLGIILKIQAPQGTDRKGAEAIAARKAFELGKAYGFFQDMDYGIVRIGSPEAPLYWIIRGKIPSSSQEKMRAAGIEFWPDQAIGLASGGFGVMGSPEPGARENKSAQPLPKEPKTIPAAEPWRSPVWKAMAAVAIAGQLFLAITTPPSVAAVGVILAILLGADTAASLIFKRPSALVNSRWLYLHIGNAGAVGSLVAMVLGAPHWDIAFFVSVTVTCLAAIGIRRS